MCGRFTLTVPEEEWVHFFHVQNINLKFQPRYNIAPGQLIAAIVADDEGTRRAGLLRWGLVPPWSSDEKIGNKMINARAETIHEKSSFRNPFLKKRCRFRLTVFMNGKKSDGIVSLTGSHSRNNPCLPWQGYMKRGQARTAERFILVRSLRQSQTN